MALAKIIDENAHAVGFAFAINGRINTADSYGSGILFRKLWNKLLEAIAELRRKSEASPKRVIAKTIETWFLEAEKTAVSDRQEVPPRVRVDTRRGNQTVVFETCDHGINDRILHSNLVTL